MKHCPLCNSTKLELIRQTHEEWNCKSCDLWFYESDLRADYSKEELEELGFA